MNRVQFAQRYAGPRVVPFAPPAGPGTCRCCGHASAECHCGCPQCRKEAKELVSQSGEADDGATRPVATAFIGGGCCAHVSVEYAPIAPSAESMVTIEVVDSEGTRLLWSKVDPIGSHYQLKESVITTKPGARVVLVTQNATARIRW